MVPTCKLDEIQPFLEERNTRDLPQGFKEKILSTTREEAGGLLSTLTNRPYLLYRTNPLKAEQIIGDAPIPGMP